MKIKRRLLALLTLLILLNAGLAYGSPSGESDVKKSDAAVASDAAKTTEAKPANSAPTTEEQLYLLNEKVRKLEELVEKQQKVIEALQPKVEAASTAAANATATADATAATVAAAPTAEPAAVAAQANDELSKKVDALYKAFGSMTISGDLKARFEHFADVGFDAATQGQDRNRGRARARIQLSGDFGKNFDWGVRVTTGSLTNPLSTNQTFTDFFNRKPIGLDRYYLRYDTKSEEGAGVSLIGGKFDYTWKRTELTFDNDLQPEGASETVYYKTKGLLKDARLVAFQLPFNEVSGGKDSVLYGGQGSLTFGKGNWAFTGAAAFLNFNQTDAIARALSKTDNQVGGGVDFGTTNSVKLDSSGNITGFLTNFNILDILGEVKYTRSNRFPIALTLDYARNMSDRLEKVHERNGYWAEIHVGQLKEKGDVEFSYTFDRVQKEAVLSVFNYDDFLSTNSRNNRATFGYTLNHNVYFQFIGLFSQRFNVLPTANNRVQKRFQFDVNYRF